MQILNGDREIWDGSRAANWLASLRPCSMRAKGPRLRRVARARAKARATQWMVMHSFLRLFARWWSGRIRRISARGYDSFLKLTNKVLLCMAV